MHFQYIPYIWPLTGSAATSLSLGIYSLLKQRNAKCAKSFILSMFVVTIWSLGNAFEMAAVDFPTKLFWANVQYIAYCYSPVTLLALSMQFTGYDKLIRNKKILWLAVLPTIILILVWTDSWHGLIRYNMHMDYSGIFPVISKKYGPAFIIHAVYSHFLNFIAWMLLIWATFLKNTVYRKQALVMSIGVGLIEIPSVLYILGISIVKRFDMTPAFFGPAGIIMAYGIFKFKLFDLVPVARATLIENIEEGVIVLDLQDRVLDFNPAFKKIVGLTNLQISGKTVKDVCGKVPELVRACIDRCITHGEFSINTDGGIKIYEVMLSPLTNKKGTFIGRLGLIHDITDKKQAQQEYLKQQWKMAVIEERERLARDLHDNLGQVLGFINLQAQGIKQELVNAGVEAGILELDKLVNVTQSAHQEIRDYIHKSRNSVYEENDFITGLTKAIMHFEEQTDLKVELDIPDGFTGEELKAKERINLLNMIKESLNNIRKHARANHVKIGFSLSENELRTAVEDDGKGFDISRNYNEAKTKFGLDIMKERVLEIGGRIDIKSKLNKGTRINFYIPLKWEMEKNEDEIDAGR